MDECKVCKRLSGRKAECSIVEFDCGGDEPREVWDGWESPLNYCPNCGRSIKEVLKEMYPDVDECEDWDIDDIDDTEDD